MSSFRFLPNLSHAEISNGDDGTLQETKVVLEGITIGGKTMREYFEAINHRDAFLLNADGRASLHNPHFYKRLSRSLAFIQQILSLTRSSY